MHQSVLLLNDISGASKVAANTNIPVLTAAGFETAIIPTVILSSNVSDQPVIHKLGFDFHRMLEHVKVLQLPFDAVLTGYFADATQVAQTYDLLKYMRQNKDELHLFIDPIMGDAGELYSSYDHTFVEQMRKHISQADIIFPNLTEACILADYPYHPHLNLDQLEEIATRLQNLGSKHVIITGIRPPASVATSQIGFYYKDNQGESNHYLHDYSTHPYMGTGDLVFSIISGFYLAGSSLTTAIQVCCELLEEIIAFTEVHPSFRRKGLYYERFLGQIANLANEYREMNNK